MAQKLKFCKKLYYHKRWPRVPMTYGLWPMTYGQP